MPILTAIVGLPASGRMHYAQQRQKAEGGVIIEMGPDVLKSERRILLETILDGRDIFFVDATLCDDRTKMAFEEFLAEFPDYEVEWVYFAHNMRLCLSNAEIPSHRHYKKIMQHIRGANKMYKVPPGVKQIPIFDQKSGKIDE
jgi:hypothetical protein